MPSTLLISLMFPRPDRVRVNIRRDRETERPKSRGRRCVQGSDSWRGARTHSFVHDVPSEYGGAQGPGSPTPRDAPLTGFGPASERAEDDAHNEVHDAEEQHGPYDGNLHSRTWISG